MNKSRWWWAVRSGKKEKKKKKSRVLRTCNTYARVNSFKDRFLRRLPTRYRWDSSLENICHRLSYRQPCRRPWAKMYFRTVCNHHSTRSENLYLQKIRAKNPPPRPGRIFIITLFLKKKKKKKKKNFSKEFLKQLEQRGALVRLKLIQRRVIIPDEFLTFHDPLVQDPRNLLGNCVKFRAIYRRSYEFRFFLFRPVDTTYTSINAQFQRNPTDAT